MKLVCIHGGREVGSILVTVKSSLEKKLCISDVLSITPFLAGLPDDLEIR